jgi:hypothetical protein
MLLYLLDLRSFLSLVTSQAFTAHRLRPLPSPHPNIDKTREIRSDRKPSIGAAKKTHLNSDGFVCVIRSRGPFRVKMHIFERRIITRLGRLLDSMRDANILLSISLNRNKKKSVYEQHEFRSSPIIKERTHRNAFFNSTNRGETGGVSYMHRTTQVLTFFYFTSLFLRILFLGGFSYRTVLFLLSAPVTGK